MQIQVPSSGRITLSSLRGRLKIIFLLVPSALLTGVSWQKMMCLTSAHIYTLPTASRKTAKWWRSVVTQFICFTLSALAGPLLFHSWMSREINRKKTYRLYMNSSYMLEISFLGCTLFGKVVSVISQHKLLHESNKYLHPVILSSQNCLFYSNTSDKWRITN